LKGNSVGELPVPPVTCEHVRFKLDEEGKKREKRKKRKKEREDDRIDAKRSSADKKKQRVSSVPCSSNTTCL
jgi:hypothetical protein